LVFKKHQPGSGKKRGKKVFTRQHWGSPLFLQPPEREVGGTQIPGGDVERGLVYKERGKSREVGLKRQKGETFFQQEKKWNVAHPKVMARVQGVKGPWQNNPTRTARDKGNKGTAGRGFCNTKE